MKNSNTQNLRLGIFVILGIAIFVAAVYFIGNRQNLFGDNSVIISVFKDVSGLQRGNNVRFAGVNVGTVKDIEIINDTSIAVSMRVDERTMNLIRKNSLATISSDGLVGSMVVNLLPGEDNSAPSPPVEFGDTITSISKIATADMLTTLNTTNENAALLTADLLKITNSINKGEGTLGALIKDEEMAGNFKKSIEGLRQSTQNVSAMVNRINAIINEVSYKESVAGVLLSDTTAAKQIEGVITNLEISALQISNMTTNLEQISYDLRKGEGTLDYLLNDPGAVDKLDSTLENIEKATKKFDESMEALQHNILFRRYFERQARIKQREEAKIDE
ncbi:MlaD family protein [Salinimicrobium sediminilitoris]|uniref:MlaD family protein n=1 Tax=Salinimicrobium sediminilitoris TaxID=2876715 RepID=UPI001E511DE6|nr:MlaD family protein [Salinimicrobium sediminilitoris]MCC8359004.1 MlaD family protein [Salinimicrobium sediminilitoris]